jgi:hypothetical protein
MIEGLIITVAVAFAMLVLLPELVYLLVAILSGIDLND